MLGIGAVIGAGIFSSIGTAAVGEVAPDGTVTRYGAGPALVLSFVLLGGGVRAGRALLRGADRHDPDLGQRLHLRLRHPGRAGGLDHRLGPDPRVRGRQRGGGHRLVRLLHVVPARRSASRCRSGSATSYRDVAFSLPGAAGASCRSLFGHRIAINVPGIVIVAVITWVLVIGIRESAASTTRWWS